MKTVFRVLFLSIISIGILNISCQKQTDYSGQLNSLQLQINNLLAQQSVINSLQVSLNNLQRRSDSLANALIINNANVYLSKIDITNQGAAISSLQTQVSTIAGQITTLNSQLISNNANVTDIKAQIIDLNNKLNSLLAQVSALYQQQLIVDIDGNVYHSVKIGSQVWMVENLKVTHYRNGIPIPNITNQSTWATTFSAGWCDYDNLSSNGNTYGHLYNIAAIKDSSNICPVGYHVPTIGDWSTLFDYLGGISTVGPKLLEAGTSHWIADIGATNSSGFTALPGGSRNFQGIYGGQTSLSNNDFAVINHNGLWWSSTVVINANGNNGIRCQDGQFSISYTDRRFGVSVRCIKD